MQQDLSDKALVYIVDDDESLRYALGRLMNSVGHTARTYGSVREFTEARLDDVPGCLILDVRLPGVSGIEFQTQLSSLDIHLPVILMTGHGDIPMSVRAMKAGAVDFLPKPFREQDMLDAVSSAIARDRDRRMSNGRTTDITDRFARLTPREQEVMIITTSGKMNKQTAAHLGISEVTVKLHRRAAMQKMGARTLADLVRMADVVRPLMRRSGGE